MNPAGHRSRILLAWVGVLLAAAVVIATHLSLSYDLGLFLPRAERLEQQVLVAKAGDAPGARYLLIAMPEDTGVPAGLPARLVTDPAIKRLPGAATDQALPPEPAWSYRYLLRDARWDADALSGELGTRLAELGLGADPAYENLVRHDPALLSLGLMEDLGVFSPGPGQARHSPVLVVETAAAPFDLDGQARAIDAVRAALAAEGIDPDAATISGAGVFGVGLRDTIHAEATWRSVAASLALALVLWLAYRRIAVLWVAALPLASGMLLGLAAVALAFGQVHGMTLAFGFTLMGVAIDYPLHWLSHARNEPPTRAMARIWPTLRLGAFSTVLAYSALLLGGAEGMAQLGLFSAAGVVTAALVTRWVLPVLAPTLAAAPADRRVHARPTQRRYGVPVLVGLVSLLLLAWVGSTRFESFWNRDLSALSPVPADQLARDAALRERVGAPNMRFQLALADPDRDVLLERLQVLHAALKAAVTRGELSGFRSLAPLLPPPGLQQARQQAIPAADDLGARLRVATAGLPFDAAVFQPFVHDALAAAAAPLLQPEDYAGTPLGALVESGLIRLPNGAGGSQWVTLVDLPGDLGSAAARDLVGSLPPGVVLVDYREASASLVAGYQHRTWRVLAAVLVLIAAVLLWRVQPARAAWTVLSVLSALLLTAWLLRVMGGPLDLYHMVGLLLVAGLGLDYALFLGRTEADAADTRHAVTTCAASTAVAFAVLAASSIPALHSLGAAVSLGVVASFAVAWLGTRGPAQA